jgi:hypothetical protein
MSALESADSSKEPRKEEKSNNVEIIATLEPWKRPVWPMPPECFSLSFLPSLSALASNDYTM